MKVLLFSDVTRLFASPLLFLIIPIFPERDSSLNLSRSRCGSVEPILSLLLYPAELPSTQPNALSSIFFFVYFLPL